MMWVSVYGPELRRLFESEMPTEFTNLWGTSPGIGTQGKGR